MVDSGASQMTFKKPLEGKKKGLYKNLITGVNIIYYEGIFGCYC